MADSSGDWKSRADAVSSGDWKSRADAVAAPEESTLSKVGHWAVDELPTIGSVVGGIAATPLDLVSGPAGTMAGAGLGGALGSIAKDTINNYISPDKQTSLGQGAKNALVQGALGGAAEGVGQVAAPYLSKAASFISKPVSDYLSNLAEKQAVKATGATGATVYNKFSDDAGRQLLDKGIVGFGDTQKSIAGKAADALDTSQQGINSSLSALDDQGANVSQDTIVGNLRSRAKALAKDPSQLDTADDLNRLADRLEAPQADAQAAADADASTASDNLDSWNTKNQKLQDQMDKLQSDQELIESDQNFNARNREVGDPDRLATNEEWGNNLRKQQSVQSKMDALGEAPQPPSTDMPDIESPTQSLVDAEQTKRGFQNKVNYNGSPLDNSVNKEAADVYRQAVEDSATKVNPKMADQFTQAKSDYGTLRPITEAAEKRAAGNAQAQGLNFHGMGRTALGAAFGGEEGYRHGGLDGAIVGATTGAFVAPRIAASTAVGADWLSGVVQNAPHLLGKYASVLTQAAARGSTSLSATDYVLQSTDPEYRQHLQDLQNQGDSQSQDGQ